MRGFFLTSDRNDILCLVHSNFCAIKIIFKVRMRLFMALKFITFAQKFELTRHKISIVFKGKKNQRIRQTNMHISEPYS